MTSDLEDLFEPAAVPESPDDGGPDPDPDSDPEDDGDEALRAAAQGVSGTSDDVGDGAGEIDAMGQAAGLAVRDDRPLRGIDEVERRDDHRWELDPASAEDDPAADAEPAVERASLRDGWDAASADPRPG